MALAKIGQPDDQKPSTQDKGLSDSKFFKSLFEVKQGRENSKAVEGATSSYLQKQDKRMEERLLLKKIANNTDTIIDLLKSENNRKKGSDFNMMDLLKWLLPLGLALPGLISPEKAKPVTTIVKATATGAKALAKGANMAAEAAQTAGKTGKIVDAASTAGKALGKFGDSKLLNKVVRYSSLGMMGGRLLDGDYLGAGGEAASLGMHEASRKVKNPKAKAILTALSFGTDAALMARDYLKGDKKEGKEEGKEAEPTIKKEESPEVQAGGIGLGSAGLLAAGVIGSAATRGALSGGTLAAGGKALSPIVEAAHIFKKIIGEASGTAGKAVSGIIEKISSLFGSGGKAALSTIVKAGASTIGKGGATALAALSTIGKGGAGAGKATSEVIEKAGKAGAGTIVKAGAKMGAKILPGVGLAMGAIGAYDRIGQGDYLGAAGEAISGIASLLPGLGTAASIAIQGGLAYRDYVKETAQDTAELGSITKDSVDKLTEENNKQASLITDTNNNITKSATDMASTVLMTGASLLSFTSLFGLNIGSWLAGSTELFGKAFNSLSSFSSSITEKMKQLGSSTWNKLTGGFTETGSDGAYTGTADKKRLKSELGKGIISSSNLGAVSSSFESGAVGVGTVSSGTGDHGGVSYGKHQMTAKTMTGFLNSKYGTEFKKEFDGLTPGSKEFSDKYKMVAKNKGDKFEVAQQKYTNKEYIGVAAHTLTKKYNFDVTKRSRAVMEALYSTAIQYGPQKAVDKFAKVIGKNGDKLTDEQILIALQDNKAKTINADFSSSSADVKKGVADRIQTEKQMLLNINKVNGGSVGTGGAVAGLEGAQSGGSLAPAKSAPATGSTAKGGTATGDTTKNNAKGGAADWDLDKLAAEAVSNAKGRKATGRCAEYVRKALEVAQNKKLFSGGLGNANEYPKKLPGIKWTCVGQNLSSFKKGDIAVFPKTGSEKGKKYGHVAIFTGSVWVSDYIQPHIQPNRALGNFPYSIWRAISGTSNGAAVGAEPGEEDSSAAGALTGAGGEDSSADSNPLDTAINAAAGALASVVTALGNSESLKSAVDFVNSAKIETSKQNIGNDVDMTGFSKISSKDQIDGGKYKFGEGGGIDEDILFNPNLERQKQGDDILGMAGSIPGIVRQKQGDDILGMAGSIPGVVRQKQGADILGMAGSIPGVVRQGDGQAGARKSKKKKWWEGLFSGSSAGLFGDLANIFGLGDEYNMASEIYGVSNSGGDLGDWAKNKAAKKLQDMSGELQKGGDVGIIPGILGPDIEGKNKIDGYISETNAKYNEYKRSGGNKSGESMPPELANLPNTSMAGSGKSNNNIDGLSSSLITRNPDSIFRAVCISIMKATTT